MRSDAKPPTAGTNHRLKQSGALAIAALLAMAIVVATAFADKEVVDYFGTELGSGSKGGELNNPRDIGVNRTGAGPADAGDIYVADDNNHRVQRFDAEGNFISAWGANVLTEPVNEVQTLTVSATEGTYTLSFEGATTSDIAFNANASTVQTALRNLQSVSGANVFVSGAGPYTINFSNGLAATDVPQITADTTLLTGTVTPATTTQGSGQYEICTVAASCRAGAPTGGANGSDNAKNGSLDNPQSVAVDNDTGDVYVSDRDNRRVNVYDGTGTFIRSFGFDVDATEAATTYEVCPAANRCKFGVAGAEVGQVGSTSTAGTLGIAVSPSDGEAAVGKVFLADSQNRRVNSYDLNGENPASFGSEAEFGTTQPRKVAVDSRGVVYASDSNSGPQIDRYDSEDANGGGVGFLSSIEAPPLLSGSGTTATSGLAVDPDSDEGGSDVDSLFVLRDPSSGSTVVQQFDESGLSAAPTSVDETHGAGAGFTTAQGLGLNDASGQLFVTATNNVSGIGSAHRVYVIDDVPAAPVAALDPVAAETTATTTAVFTGTVDPNGGFVTGCKFQYSVDQVVWTDAVEPDCDSFAPGGGAQAISEKAFGLQPGTHYFVRLQVDRLFVPGSTVTTAVKVFDTDSGLPTVADAGAVDVQRTSARLVGAVNPSGSATGYVFEYGATPALGSSTPPVSVGSGSESVVVSQQVGGLAKDTEYFVRLVATNTFGVASSAQATFHTRAVALPNPENRAYEQVSPVDKNGSAAYTHPVQSSVDSSASYVAPGGGRIAFSSPGDFGDPVAQRTKVTSAYTARRTAAGWESKAVRPPFCAFDATANVVEIDSSVFVSRDISRAAFHYPEGAPGPCPTEPLDPQASIVLSGPRNNLYHIADLWAEPRPYDLLNVEADELNQGPGLATNAAGYQAASDDQTHVVFQSRAAQSADAPPPAAAVSHLYDWRDLGSANCTAGSPSYVAAIGACVSLVSRDPSGALLTGASQVPGAGHKGIIGSSGFGNADSINAVSASGDRIFFQNATSGGGSLPTPCIHTTCRIYMREDNAVTHDVSLSECTATCGETAAKTFRMASVTGDRALFTSAEKLTDDPSTPGDANLYLYTHSANPAIEPNLTHLSADDEAGDGDVAAVRSLVDASDDLSVVFFVADGQLIAGEPIEAGPKLYRWSENGGSPALDYLAALDATDTENWLQNERRLTPDGKTLMIESAARIVPAADHDSDTDVYRWTETGGFACVSCQEPGAASGGDSTTSRTGTAYKGEFLHAGVTSDKGTAMTDDGERIFFLSPDALVPADINGPCAFDTTNQYYPCADVYEWHDGRISLISPGDASGTLTELLGTSATGDDVFIATAQPLVGWDRDEAVDIYDARVGGGFPEPPEESLCEGEGCRDAGSSAPGIAGAGSTAFQGPGNLTAKTPAKRCPGNKLRRGKRCLTVAAIARKRCRRLGGVAKQRCIRKQARRLRRAQRRAKRRAIARAANNYRRASR